MTYRKLPIAEKARVARDTQREPSVTCPRCATGVMPADLATHGLRCGGVMPAPHPCGRWLTRHQAMEHATASVLDGWVERGLVRVRANGMYLERDVAIAAAWARALEAL